jgi:uncharacterized peroxidase-related enzyme
MDQRTRPAPRLAPLPPEHTPELNEQFEAARKRLGFVPNSVLVMQRNPKMVRAFTQMSAAIWDPQGKVDLKLKRLISHVASRSAGCQYCMAHTAEGAVKVGVDQHKLDAVWDYQSSPHFNAAERAALDVAVAAGGVPNAVTDEMFMELRKHWSDEQVVEIVGIVAMFGFLNRWNDSMATPLEPVPVAVASKAVGAQGWTPGKHAR